MLNNLKTLFIGQPIHLLEVVDSTNSFASNLLAKSKPSEGTVIFSSFQTNGRGQYGKNWEGDAGKNIYISIILRPTFLDVQHVFYLNKILSLAVHACVACYTSKPTTIKWPNDVFVKHQKIAGVLVENQLEGRKIKSSICGIGLNVNQQVFQASANNAVSIQQLNNQAVPLEEVLKKLLEHVEYYYLLLRSNQLKQIDASYHKQLYLLQHPIHFKTNTEVVRGTLLGVSKTGSILLQTDKGQQEYTSGFIVL